MDGTADPVTKCKEAHMDAQVWFELLIVVLKIVAAGLAD
jgi:hypothetical protein